MSNLVYQDSACVIFQGDSLDILKTLPDKSVDLVMTSPPYENARTYGIDFNLKGDVWVTWAIERFVECHRVCKGLTAWVIEGRTRDFQWSATPVLFMAELHRKGIKLRKPPIFHRIGVPGSGGDEWLRNDYEFIVCATHGRLPWADNTAMGKPPQYKAGGATTNRKKNGERVGTCKYTDRRPSGELVPRVYIPPEISNPGNVISCGAGGGGHLGSSIAHENEAPYPESLTDFFVRSFCPSGGVVLDPFCGSGTTIASAIKHGRQAMGIDLRSSQTDLTIRRIAEALAGAT